MKRCEHPCGTDNFLVLERLPLDRWSYWGLTGETSKPLFVLLIISMNWEAPRLIFEGSWLPHDGVPTMKFERATVQANDMADTSE
jgi:hypothetical protein